MTRMFLGVFSLVIGMFGVLGVAPTYLTPGLRIYVEFIPYHLVFFAQSIICIVLGCVMIKHSLPVLHKRRTIAG